MSEKAIPMGKAIPIIVVAWILSLVSTLAIVYLGPGLFPVTADKIAGGAVITAKLADGSVTSAKILDGAITAADLADGSILSVKVVDGAVTTAKIADGAVTSLKIADGAIVTIKLADGAVTSAKILDGTVTAEDLATGSVTTIKIADGAVTTTKIADYAVTNLKLAANAIPFNSTYRTETISKTTASWADIQGMSVTITLERKSTLLIMFSGQCAISAADQSIQWRALVNTAEALPGAFYLQPPGAVNLWSSISYTFYKPDVSAGQYTVRMQWYVSGGTGAVGFGTLIVIALPA